jgi:hypothetical protein
VDLALCGPAVAEAFAGSTGEMGGIDVHGKLSRERVVLKEQVDSVFVVYART